MGSFRDDAKCPVPLLRQDPPLCLPRCVPGVVATVMTDGKIAFVVKAAVTKIDNMLKCRRPWP